MPPRRQSRGFDPQSLDSTLARLSEKMDNHHSYTREQFEAAAKERAEIRAEVKKTNGRVTALEFWKGMVKTQAATVAAIVSGLVTLVALGIAYYKG